MLKNPDKPDALAREMATLDEGERVRRWRQGMQAAEQRQRAVRAAEGPRPAQAVAESLSVLNALEAMGRWPGARDPVGEERVQGVRERWARIQRRARAQTLKQGDGGQALEAAVARATAQFEAELRRLARAALRAVGLRLGAGIAGSPAGPSQRRRRPRQGRG